MTTTGQKFLFHFPTIYLSALFSVSSPQQVFRLPSIKLHSSSPLRGVILLLAAAPTYGLLCQGWDDIMINTGARKQRVMARQGHVFFLFSSLDQEPWSWWLQLIICLIWEPAAAAELCPLFTII